MSSVLLVYTSRTGFTKKYVDWIAERLPCEQVPLGELSSAAILDHDILVYGAGMHAGRILGLKEFKKHIRGATTKEVVVFATGGAPFCEDTVKRIKEHNFSGEEVEKIPFFYFQSGMNYERLGLADKAMMASYSMVLKLKRDKSDVEEGTSKALSTSYDHSSVEFIKPLLDHLNERINT